MKKFLWIIAGIIGVIALFIFFTYKEERGKYSLPEKDYPLLRIEGINFIGWNEKGEEMWRVSAKSGEEFQQSMILKEVELVLLEDGIPVSKGRAGKVSIDLQTSNLILEEGIKVISCLHKAELSTSTLEWKASEKKLVTEDKIIFKRGDLITEGRGLVADTKLSQVIIKSEIVTRLVGEKK
ncbi:LPS export ABC transporter periplasmic protein LptC [Candidatus Aerophobetes bacterium]|nr:LPS export ABC transporter periplasmic protein LptC [Candidatus Aerophobetes bacterium]